VVRQSSDERNPVDVTRRQTNEPPRERHHARSQRPRRAKRFYGESLGWPIQQDYPQWASFGLANGSSALGLYAWDALAEDAGVAPEASGFRGFTLSYLVRSDERVAAVLAEAERAGGKVVKPADATPWGGASGYFTDPEGYLWKVASGTGQQPFAE
jgi:predicted enzyme related to lactoylglutathione lyase